MKKIGVLFLLVSILITQNSCIGRKSIIVELSKEGTPSANEGHENEDNSKEIRSIEDNESKGIITADEKALIINTNNDSTLPLESNNFQILEHINPDMIELLKFILYQDLNLEEMGKEYGPIMEVTWDEGAYYKHEKLDIWISYYFSDTFVVDFSEESYITKKIGEVESYGIDYTIKGPYTILEEAKEAFVFGSKCELSELFNEVGSISIDDFEPFAVIEDSLLWFGKSIEFDFDGLYIGIVSADDLTIHPESTAFIRSSVSNKH